MFYTENVWWTEITWGRTNGRLVRYWRKNDHGNEEGREREEVDKSDGHRVSHVWEQKLSERGNHFGSNFGSFSSLFFSNISTIYCLTNVIFIIFNCLTSIIEVGLWWRDDEEFEINTNKYCTWNVTRNALEFRN